MARSKSKGKQTKTFLKKGLLEGQIKKRHQTRDFKQKVQNRKVKRNKKGTGHPQHRNEFNEDERDEVDIPLEAKDAMSDVDEQEGDSEPADDSDDSHDTVEALSDDLRDESSDDEDFGDDEKHASDLKALAEKDPNFFKYLQENDAELLKFTTGQAVAEAGDENSQDSDSDGGLASRRPKGKSKKTEAAPVLTLRIVREWEQHLIKTQSLRTLRKLLIAFRAALASEGGADSAQSDWVVQNPSVFRRVVRTTLKFVPAVLRQRIPIKGDADNKTRKQITSKQRAAAQRLVKSYFVSLHNLTQAVAGDSALVVLAIKESANLFPYILSNRKILRSWTRVLQRLFADGNDEARVAAIAALRTLASSADATCCQDVIKGLFTTLLDATRKTSPYTLPTITFMKNAITQVLLLDTKQAQSVSYRVAFTYIRMLALLLRKAVKEGSPDSLKAVCNWQFVHAIDFWSLVLSSASEAGQESPLRQLIYPLVQTALGAIRLVPTARYFPFRFQVLRSLLRIVKRTGVFLSIVAPLFEVLDCPELTTRLKSSSLKPIDLEYFVRCPSAYLRTRAYADALVDETVYLMTDYFSAMSTSIAFPELALPAMIGIRKITKRSGQAKLASQMKTLLEKLESNSKWIEQQRENVHFAPQQLDQVDRFLQDVKTDSTPLGAFAKVVQKNRDERRAILDKAAFKVEEEDAA